MIKNIFNITIFVIVILFFYFIVKIYLSEKNIKIINLNRLNTNKNILAKTNKLQILKNDTNNVIEFNSGFNINENTKVKKKFWELFNSE